jgi:hypothetical protein
VLRIVQKELQANNLDVTLRCGTRPSHEESLPVAHGTVPGLKEGMHSGRVDEGQVLEIQDDRRDAVGLEGARVPLRMRTAAMSRSPLKAMVATPSFSCDRAPKGGCNSMARPFLGDHQSGDGREIGALAGEP